MAFVFTGRFAEDVERRMRGFYISLSEKDRRRFAAIEAQRLGHGGVTYIAELFGCSERTIERAAHELDDLPNDPAAGRVRRPGAGRKKRSSPVLRSNKI
jgi:transcriptional antiterminator